MGEIKMNFKKFLLMIGGIALGMAVIYFIKQ